MIWICISPNLSPKVQTQFSNDILHIFTWMSNRDFKSNIENWTDFPCHHHVLSHQQIFLKPSRFQYQLSSSSCLKKKNPKQPTIIWKKPTLRLIFDLPLFHKTTHLSHWRLFQNISRIYFSLFPCCLPPDPSQHQLLPWLFQANLAPLLVFLFPLLFPVVCSHRSNQNDLVKKVGQIMSFLCSNFFSSFPSRKNQSPVTLPFSLM